MTVTALLAVACYVIHLTTHVAGRRLHELLWVCNVSALLVAFGLCAGRPGVTAPGVLWLAIGLPVWALDLAMGGEFLLTSILTHVGSLALGLHGFRGPGLPGGSWRWASVLGILLVAAARVFTPPAANVNVAFRIQPGWERLFPSHPRYLSFLLVLFPLLLFLAERALNGVLERP